MSPHKYITRLVFREELAQRMPPEARENASISDSDQFANPACVVSNYALNGISPSVPLYHHLQRPCASPFPSFGLVLVRTLA